MSTHTHSELPKRSQFKLPLSVAFRWYSWASLSRYKYIIYILTTCSLSQEIVYTHVVYTNTTTQPCKLYCICYLLFRGYRHTWAFL